MKLITCILIFQFSSFLMLQGTDRGKIKYYLTKESIHCSQSELEEKLIDSKYEKYVRSYPLKQVLIILGNCNDSLMTLAAANELSNILGHFNSSIDIIKNKNYHPEALKKYDVLFYVGLQKDDNPSKEFLNDIYKSLKTIVWLNAGFSVYQNSMDTKGKYGFSIGNLDQSMSYNVVKYENIEFSRGGKELYTVQINNNKKVKVIASAINDESEAKLPYIIKSQNLYYIADIPYFNCTLTDRYLLFADVLHDIMKEDHPREHKAIIRIEDVTPMRDPDRLRQIADILSQHKIPFLIGVVPFYIDPVNKINISLSDKPELVAALKYCVSKGATIVLHGVTHQYKGVSAVDFEFWDGSKNKPIANENDNNIENKIEEGLDECAKNGIYPLYWETPHYTASIEDYKIISNYFSSSVERLIVTNSFKYGQFFPYEIYKDIYGQKVYPEDLGYMPLIAKNDSSEMFVQKIISNAKELLTIRDGYASFFFHPFVNLDYLKEITNGISNLGYKYVDMRKETNWVKSKDLVILSGSQQYTFTVNNNSLTEIYYNSAGQIERKIVSAPSKGLITKNIYLRPDEIYVAQIKIIEHKNIVDLNNHNNNHHLTTTVSRIQVKN